MSIGVAFLAGVISFLSPCVFPLVPAYLAQLTGSGIVNQQLQADQRVVLTRSIGFILGFTSIFIFLGASSSFIGQLFMTYRTLFEKLGGIVIVVFGLQMAGVLTFSFLLQEKRLIEAVPEKAMMNFTRSVLFGFLFGTGWTPCIGLILSSILILASQSDTMWTGMFLLFVYSLGLGVPFLLIAMFWSRSLYKFRKVNQYLPVIQKVSGVIMVVLGVLLFTGMLKLITIYLSRFISFTI
ncbi:cytochrome c biogenesis CcdA family protein [Brevibacillus centrosporus]|uniref:cytochrome c biogenesis CcdA family protein n=1 Tax=Brevibacillus centrosporus TaxID=54910 RepID=UPI003B01FF3D